MSKKKRPTSSYELAVAFQTQQARAALSRAQLNTVRSVLHHIKGSAAHLQRISQEMSIARATSGWEQIYRPIPAIPRGQRYGKR